MNPLITVLKEKLVSHSAGLKIPHILRNTKFQ